MGTVLSQLALNVNAFKWHTINITRQITMICRWLHEYDTLFKISYNLTNTCIIEKFLERDEEFEDGCLKTLWFITRSQG